MRELLERERDLAELAGALDAAERGAGSLTLVEGPAGIGKSRLLAAAGEQAGGRRFLVLRARGLELEREVPFGVATELFAPVMADAPPARRRRLLAGQAGLAQHVLEPDGAVAGDPQALVRGLYWLTVGLAGDRRPLALVLDDAHWADRLSLTFLAHLAARLDGLPVALIVAARSDEPGAAEALRDAPVRARVAPRPLSETGVARLVAEELADPEPPFASACARVSGGNPFLTRELARALRADGIPPIAASVPRVENLVPASVLHSVLGRLGRLGAGPGRLATAVAVLGDGTLLRHAGRLADMPPREGEQAADALAGAGILAEGEPLRFTHPLIASAVHSDMPAFGRSRAHREAAGLLAADGAGVQEVAAHLLVSRPEGDAWVVERLRAAARRAAGHGDSQTAARLLTRALGEPPTPTDRVDVLLELAGAEAAHGDLAAEGHAREALDLADAAGRRPQALHAMSRVWLGLRRHEDAAAALREVLDGLDVEAPEREPVLAAYLTTTRFLAALHPETSRELDPLLARARNGSPPGDPALLAHVTLDLALAGEPAETVRVLAERATAEDPLVDPGTYGVGMGMVVQALCAVDELEVAERIAEAALVAARRQGSLLVVATASFHRAIPRYHRGALADALADLDQALAPLEEGWAGGGAWAFALQARVHLERGDVAAARASVEQAPDVSTTMDAGVLGFARARVALAEREPAIALAEAEAAGRYLAERFGIDHPGLVPWRRTAALAALALGDRDRASELCTADLARARALGGPRVLGQALRTQAALTDSEAERLELLAAAASALAQSPSALPRAHALVELGAALRRGGRREAALEPLRESLQLADGMGATPLAEAARAELRASGVRPRRAAHTGIAALTPAERRTAQLATTGLTNRQIAEELFVTQKTVQTHLAHAYRKLGITSRRDLAAQFGA